MVRQVLPDHFTMITNISHSYSKLPFRLLMRDHAADVTYTPMILAHEFIRSAYARDSDFTTSEEERQPSSDGRSHGLIAQFASSDPVEFARATDLIAPWVDGIDLNCGCPQSWAMKEGIGCSLMSQPDLVAKMVVAAKARLPSDKSVSCKIRISKNLDETKRWIRTVEDAGVDYITIHGRTRSQRSSTPPDFDAIRELAAGVRVPVIANGDVYTLDDATRIARLTGVDGVMAARGILERPALYDESNITAEQCVKELLECVVRCPIPFPLVLHHMSDLTTDRTTLSKGKRKELLSCRDMIDLIDFVEEQWGSLR